MIGLTRDEQHRYQWNGGPKVPGVTSIIKTLDKSGPLVGWAKRETASSAVRNLPMLAKMLEEGGDLAAIAWLKNIPDYRRDTAADLGTRVHAIAEALARKQPVEVPEDAVGHVEAYQRWLHDAKPKFRAAEFMVYSETDHYGGTGDAIFVLKGELYGVDYKTGRNVYPETALQLAGIFNASFAGKSGDPKKYKITVPDRFGVLHIRADGVELIPYSVTRAEWLAFMACRVLRKWLDERAELVKEKV